MNEDNSHSLNYPCDTLTPKPRKYEYDPHLATQLIWTGKVEQKPLIKIIERLQQLG